MKRVVLIVMAFFFGVTNVVAQQSDSVNFENLNARIDSLQTKLDKLQANYDYLSCENKINRVRFELLDKYHEIKISANNLQIEYYHNGFNEDSYILHKKYYDSIFSSVNQYRLNVEFIKASVLVETMLPKFSDAENQYLKFLCNNLDVYMQAVEDVLNAYKSILDIYKSKSR